MIISLQHNYIYIRTRKTGSSTIESILRDNLGPDDIVVKESLETLTPILKPGAVLPEDEGLITHVPIYKVKPLIREDIWDRMFIFTSERHPYEKALSFTHYRLELMGDFKRDRKLAKYGGFEGYLDRTVRRGKYSSFVYYSIDGKSAAHDYIRLETMRDDMHRIGKRIGVPMPDEMPHKRETERIEFRPAREVLNAEQKDIIYYFCKPEFELLGYER
ncbi:MAG TPA: hypothetical protein VMF58_12935 [Rhizomicrobium sp.]|nr:hypothetical protein [Rhizomicrobium sp.]